MKKQLPRPDPIERLPVAIFIIKSNCNCRCSMCDIWQDTSRRELSESLISEILPQLMKLGTREVVLSGGEPLMHSEIEKICRAVKSANLKLTLLTTGLLLKHHADWICESVDQIYVSLDGPEAVHNKIRNIPDAYGKLAAGVNAVRTINPHIGIGARCTVHLQNFRHLSHTVLSARSLNLDSISFLAADVQSGNFGRSKDWQEKDLKLSNEKLIELRESLDQLYLDNSGDFERGFIVENQEKLERKLYNYFKALAGQDNYPPVHCNAPWVSTVIEIDGHIRPCFFHKPFPGNVKQQALSDILNSNEARTWRQGLDTGSNPVCRTCVCSLALAD